MSFGRRKWAVAFAFAVAAIVTAILTWQSVSNSPVTAGDSLPGALPTPDAQAQSSPITGLYRNTNEGFSVTLPNGWVGEETGTKPQVLSGSDNPSQPAVIVEIYVFRLGTPKDAETWVTEELATVADDVTIIPGQAMTAAPDTTAYQAIGDWSSSGTQFRDIWTAFGRGTQMVLLRTYMLQSSYTARSASVASFVNSFAFEVPAPFGASQSDSLFLLGGEIRTIDPAQYRGNASSIVGALFNGLVMLNRDLEVEPAIAASWDIDETGTVYTFHIHPDAKFHDGRQITAQDVKYSWERVADPATDSPTARTYLGDIVGVDEMLDGEADHISGLEVVNDLTLKVTIDSPKVYFIQKLTYPTAYIVDQQNIEADGDEWTKTPNGTGRFKLKAWEDDDLLVLERFDDYHLGAPKLKNIVFQLFAGVGIQMYEAGEIDITGVSGANIERAMDPQNPLNQDLVEGVGMCTNYLYFNVDQPPFDDVNVRRAFAMAIDFDKIIEVANKGHADHASSILPPGIPGYLPGQFDVEYDPEAARELLEQSEYFTSGLLSEPLLSYSGDSAFHWMWETNLGVDIVDVSLIDSDDWFNRRDAGEFGFGLGGWCADYPDPQNFLDVLFHTGSDENHLGYSNPEVDALLDEAASEPDLETRLGLYTEAESLILDDWVVVPFLHPRSYTLVKPYVENYADSPIGVQDYHLLEINR